MKYLLTVVVVLGLTSGLTAQTAPPLTVTGGSVATCAPLRVRAPYGPSPDVIWTMRLTWQAEGSTTVNNWQADSAPSYDRSRTFPVGRYTIAGRWTASGKADVPITPFAHACPAGTAPPPPPPPGPEPITCVGAWGVAQPTGDWSLWEVVPGSDPLQERRTRPTTQVYTITTPAANGGTPCEAENGATRPGALLEETRSVTALPAIHGGPVTDPESLGTCTEAEHDAYSLVGPDGRRYRTWHPQRLKSGCVTGHEHGHDPGPARAAIIQWAQSRPVTAQFTQSRKDALVLEMQQPILFGYIQAQAAGHPIEPHEGFKQFYTLYGECNNEGRCSQMISEHTTHMGTFGVGRYQQSHHSVRKLQIHVPSGSYEVTQGMLDFGAADMVCSPRQSPTRDFITLNSRCRIDSAYEIWQGTFTIRQGTQTLYRGIATPAAFDPITVRNPANETEVVYAWDPRVVATTRAHATPSWADHRGSDREAYAQPGYFETTQHVAAWADVMTGQVVPAGTAGALPQFFYAPQTGQELRGSTGVPADNGNPPNHAFKVRRPNNDLRAFLGLKN
jgi:hypothetical protein